MEKEVKQRLLESGMSEEKAESKTKKMMKDIKAIAGL